MEDSYGTVPYSEQWPVLKAQSRVQKSVGGLHINVIGNRIRPTQTLFHIFSIMERDVAFSVFKDEGNKNFTVNISAKRSKLYCSLVPPKTYFSVLISLCGHSCLFSIYKLNYFQQASSRCLCTINIYSEVSPSRVWSCSPDYAWTRFCPKLSWCQSRETLLKTVELIICNSEQTMVPLTSMQVMCLERVVKIGP